MENNNNQNTQPKKITAGMVFSWIFGVIYILGGIGIIGTNALAGVIYLLVGLYILPPLNQMLVKATGFKLTGVLVFIVVLISTGIAGALYSSSMPAKSPKSENIVNVSSSNTQSIPDNNSVSSQPQPSEPTKPQVPADHKSALAKAKTYSSTMNMSKKGIYNQLTSTIEGFSTEAAQYAIDNVQADWNANALAKAKSYQSLQNMSPNAIKTQLTSQFEGFTEEEANYAISKL